MKSHPFLIALAGLFLMSCTDPAAPAAAWPDGIYGNVKMSGETGDLGGFEARFYRDGERRMVEFVHCEGWCNVSYTSEVARDGSGFAFEHSLDPTVPEHIEPRRMRFKVTPVGDRLGLEGWHDGERIAWEASRTLPRIQQPFGLNVANAEDAE